MKPKKLPMLLIPAIKAKMGDWNYYITFMRFSDVAERIKIVAEIHTAETLRDMLQRGLKNRAPDIADYLKMQKQRFFNALVIGTYGGHPEWRELEIGRSRVDSSPAPQYAEGALGFLTLQGTEQLFAIDGQHRVAGIRRAIKERPNLREEEIAAIFVRGVQQSNRDEDPDGFERTRRLFTTLNSRGKPVGKGDIIALDEDDVVAIITRELVEEHPLFKEKVYGKEARSISPQNRTAFTTVIALYDGLDVFLKPHVKTLKFGKRRRPTEDEMIPIRNAAEALYSLLIKSFTPLSEMASSQPAKEVAGKYRNATNGGHLFFRPIGFTLVHRVIAKLVQSGESVKTAVKRLGQLPMMLDKEPWSGLLWDSANHRMITAPENQRVAERLTFYCVGGDLARYRTTAEALKDEWAGLLHRKPNQVRLPKVINTP